MLVYFINISFIKLQKLSTADFACVVRFNYYHGRYYQVFRSSLKKGDLIDTSKTEEDPKKIREASSASFAHEGDVFNEGIDSSGCRGISFNCLKNLETKVTEIYEHRNENKNMHIKGVKQLVDLAESVKFMTSKFDELEKDQKEKEKVIYNLKGEVCYLSELRSRLEESIDAQQQYSRINCLFSMALKKLKVKTLTIWS